MNLPESPPSLHELLVFGGFELLMEPCGLARRFHVSLQLVFQRLHQAGNSHHHRNPLVLDGAHHLARIQRVLEQHGRCQQLRQEDTQELSEDMAERQQIEKAQRMKDALVLQILADLALQRLQVGEDVAVSDDHAARLGRRS